MSEDGEDWLEQPGSALLRRFDPTLIVVDDWPEAVPATEAELRVFEAYFGSFRRDLRLMIQEKAPT